MQSKKIAIAINSLTGGGAEKVMLTLASELIKQGHQPHLLVLFNHCEHHIPANIPIHFCFSDKDRYVNSFWNINKSAQKLQQKIEQIEAKIGKFDLYLSNLDKTNLLMTKTTVSPLYCVIHNSKEEELKRAKKLGPFAYLRLLKSIKALNNQNLITVSDGIKHEIEQEKRIIPASIQTIYNPFLLNDIQQQAQTEVQGIPDGEYLIHVGRCAKQKRHDILFQALKLMNNELPLVLLCNNPKKVKKLAEKYGVSDRLIIPGFQKNPFPWIRNAKLMVLSSDFEGLPTVLIESLACGTPVVSTDCNHGPKEILTGALAKYLVPCREPQSLATKVDEALTELPLASDAKILAKVEASEIAKAYLKLA